MENTNQGPQRDYLFPNLEKWLEASSPKKRTLNRVKKRFHDEVVLDFEPMTGVQKIHAVKRTGEVEHVDFTPDSWAAMIKNQEYVSMFTHGDLCELPIETVNRARVKAGLEPLGLPRKEE